MAEFLNAAGAFTLIAIGWTIAGAIAVHTRKIWFEGTHTRDSTELRKRNW